MFYNTLRVREQKKLSIRRKKWAEIECNKSLSVLLDKKNGTNYKTRGKRETDLHSLICMNRPAKSSSAGKAFSLLIDDIHLSPGDLTLDEAPGRTSCRHA